MEAGTACLSRGPVKEPWRPQQPQGGVRAARSRYLDFANVRSITTAPFRGASEGHWRPVYTLMQINAERL